MTNNARQAGRNQIRRDLMLSLALLLTVAVNGWARTAAQSAPTAIAVATPQSGAAPLAVTFTGSGSDTDGSIVLYEWDFDGDGVFDYASGSSANTTFTYTMVANYTAMLRVTDNDGLTGTATVAIGAAGAAVAPPGAALTVNPISGDVSTVFQFTVTGSIHLSMPSPPWGIVLFEVDFEGDGQFDWSQANSDPLVLSATASHVYGTPGTYAAVGRVTKDHIPPPPSSPLSAKTAAVTVTVAQPTNLKVWISVPQDGDSVWGNAVTLRANTAPGNLTARVKFQYRIQGNIPWIDIGTWIVPPPFSFATTWDVTVFPDPTTVELRAVAEDTANPPNTVASNFITLLITDATKIREFDLTDRHEKTQRVEYRMSQSVTLRDGTEVTFPYGVLQADTPVTLQTLSTATETPPAGTRLVGYVLDVAMTGNPTLRNLARVRFAYPDVDGDGFVDGTRVLENRLRLYRKSGGVWTPLLAVAVDPNENVVTATTIQFSPVILAGPEEAAPSSGGGGGGSCHAAGAGSPGVAILMLAALGCLLCRPPASRGC